MHKHEETWLLLLSGRKAWWISEKSNVPATFARRNPCQHIDSSTPPGYQFCIQQPGEVVCLVSFQQFFIYTVAATVTVMIIIIVIIVIIITILVIVSSGVSVHSACISAHIQGISRTMPSMPPAILTASCGAWGHRAAMQTGPLL